MIPQTILFVLQWFFAAVGITGNIWVIIAILRYNAIKKTTNKILFINLAIADEGVLIVRNSFYFLYHYYDNRWLFGKITCKIAMPISLMFMPASLLILVTISYSRCLTIVDVKQMRQLSARKAWYIVAFIWAFVIILYPFVEIPVRKVNETAQSCDMDIPQAISYVLHGFEDLYFLLSFLAIAVMFIRMRKSLNSYSKISKDSAMVRRLMKNRKALKLLWPVVIVLFITIIPTVMIESWVWMKGNREDIPMFVFHFVDILMVTNSAANPFIYIIVSTEFRQRILKTPCLRYFRDIWSKSKAQNLTEDILLPCESNDFNESKV